MVNKRVDDLEGTREREEDIRGERDGGIEDEDEAPDEQVRVISYGMPCWFLSDEEPELLESELLK